VFSIQGFIEIAARYKIVLLQTYLQLLLLITHKGFQLFLRKNRICQDIFNNGQYFVQVPG
jgi:hypothetical protein